MPDKLFMPTHPSSPFSHAYTRTHHQPDSSPPGLAQWVCYIKASAYGSRLGWTPARTIHTYIHTGHRPAREPAREPAKFHYAVQLAS